MHVPSTPAPPSTSEPSHQAYLTRLTERLAERLRVELQTEVERAHKQTVEANRRAEERRGRVLDDHLAREIESHTCAICYELMLPPDRGPILLFPCGHTFCAACVHHHTHEQRRGNCPLCRVQITSRAPNISLQQVIEAYSTKQKQLDQNQDQTSKASTVSFGGMNRHGNLEGDVDVGVDHDQDPDPDLDGLRDHPYTRQLAQLEIRCRVLRHEMEDCAREEAVASQESREAAAVAQLLAQEEIPAAEARVAEAQAQLEGLQLQVATFEKEAVTKSEVAEGLRTRAGMVQDTLRGLEQEMVKVQYLVQACSDKNASG